MSWEAGGKLEQLVKKFCLFINVVFLSHRMCLGNFTLLFWNGFLIILFTIYILFLKSSIWIDFIIAIGAVIRILMQGLKEGCFFPSQFVGEKYFDIKIWPGNVCLFVNMSCQYSGPKVLQQLTQLGQTLYITNKHTKEWVNVVYKLARCFLYIFRGLYMNPVKATWLVSTKGTLLVKTNK